MRAASGEHVFGPWNREQGFGIEESAFRGQGPQLLRPDRLEQRSGLTPVLDPTLIFRLVHKCIVPRIPRPWLPCILNPTPLWEELLIAHQIYRLAHRRAEDPGRPIRAASIFRDARRRDALQEPAEAYSHLRASHSRSPAHGPSGGVEFLRWGLLEHAFVAMS